MNLLEAIQNCGENWFRPVRLSGQGCAYSKGDTYIRFNDEDPCPDDNQFLTPALCDITGEWEIVTPEQVMNERK